MGVDFLNVDLEIELRQEQPELLAAFGPKIHVLYNGATTRRKWLLALEVATGKTPQKKIEAFCALIEKFSPTAQKQWQTALLRRFDVGFEANRSGQISTELFSSELLKRVANLSAEIGLTIYPGKSTKK